MMKPFRALVLGALASMLFSVGGHAYATYATWGSSPTFYLNPANADVQTTVAEAAVQAGLGAWNTQSGSSFHGTYGGRVSDTTAGNDRRNVVIFRKESNGSAIATTYSWWKHNNTLIDADIIFWDGGFTFFGGSTGCGGSRGAYIEDIAAHEFGHALGLNHSADAAATMYPSYSICSQSMRSLSADDRAGAQALYPADSGGGANTAPVVTIASPGNGSSVAAGTALTFAGSASDVQQGNMSSSLVWTSNLEGQIGLGASFSRALTVAGTHYVTAATTDSGGLAGSGQIAVVVTAVAPGTGRALSATGYKVKGRQMASLTWTVADFATATLDVYRGGTKIMSIANDGGEIDDINRKGRGAYAYQVCESGTSACSNQAIVTF